MKSLVSIQQLCFLRQNFYDYSSKSWSVKCYFLHQSFQQICCCRFKHILYVSFIVCSSEPLYRGMMADTIQEEDFYLFKIQILTGKKATNNWLKCDPPELGHWLAMVGDKYSMEKLTKAGTHKQCWGKTF